MVATAAPVDWSEALVSDAPADFFRLLLAEADSVDVSEAQALAVAPDGAWQFTMSGG